VRSLLAVLIALSCAGGASAQSQQQPAAAEAPVPAAPITALVEQLADLFPKVQGEVLEAQGGSVTLDIGRKDGVQPGLVLEVIRQGREITHPRTGQVLGRVEDTVGTVTVAAVQERFSTARSVTGGEVKPGDRVRVSAAKVKLTLLAFSGGLRDT